MFVNFHIILRNFLKLHFIKLNTLITYPIKLTQKINGQSIELYPLFLLINKGGVPDRNILYKIEY